MRFTSPTKGSFVLQLLLPQYALGKCKVKKSQNNSRGELVIQSKPWGHNTRLDYGFAGMLWELEELEARLEVSEQHWGCIKSLFYREIYPGLKLRREGNLKKESKQTILSHVGIAPNVQPKIFKKISYYQIIFFLNLYLPVCELVWKIPWLNRLHHSSKIKWQNGISTWQVPLTVLTQTSSKQVQSRVKTAIYIYKKKHFKRFVGVHWEKDTGGLQLQSAQVLFICSTASVVCRCNTIQVYCFFRDCGV